MNFNGIPLHPLVVHAVVVLTPLAVLLALAYAVVARWRWLVRWPLVLVTVVATAATFVAVESGENLRDRLHLNSELLHEHMRWGNRLELGMYALTVVVLVAAYVMPFSSPIVGRGDRAARIGVLRIPVALALVVVAVAVAYAVYRTGDAGAHLVWDGTPS